MISKLKIVFAFLLISILAIVCRPPSNTSLSGTSWNGKPQQIPGKVQCEYYNLDGEGVAYHDTDSINNGSGKLNPANGTFLNEFRMKEGVDISYTKSNDIDINPFNKVEPKLEQLYVGWTQPGEWINYSVDVAEAGVYQIGLMYTANGDGSISLDVDGKPIGQEFKVTSTNDEGDPIAWRQWHHWNRIDSLAQIKLTKGIHLITLRTVKHGNMNYDYLEFTKVKN